MEKKYKISLTINIIIILFGFVSTIINTIGWLMRDGDINTFTTACVDILLYVCIAYYTLKGYKKPHGNLLKYMMLLFAFMIVVSLKALEFLSIKEMMLFCFAVGLICYMAGRLNKFNEVKIISLVVMLLLLHCCHAQVSAMSTFMDLAITTRFNFYAKVIIWMALTTSYFTRYLQHKEAGLQD